MPKDFLSNLSMRAIHETGTKEAAGALRPRLGSLFEPAILPVLPLPAVPGEEADAEEIEQQPRPQPRERLRGAQPQAGEAPVSQSPHLEMPVPQPLSSTQNGETAPGARSLVAGEQPASPQFVPPVVSRIQVERITEVRTVGPIPSVERAPEGPRSRDRKESHPEGPEESGSRTRKASPAELPSIPRLVPEQILLTRPENPPDQKETRRTPEPGLISESPARERVIPEHILITRQELPPRSEGEPGLVPASSISERRAWEDAQRGPGGGAAQPPTIHVTIGRIEVKASSSAPASKAAPPVPTTMSLDEYMRRRQGGNR